jgi:hypothetical protein
MGIVEQCPYIKTSSDQTEYRILESTKIEKETLEKIKSTFDQTLLM